jgi:uncharacterized protein (TIGR00255 family)
MAAKNQLRKEGYMIKSMTGFGKGQASAEGVSLTVELRSVNHRYADIAVKVPRSLLALEADIKKRVGERLRRGKIDIFVTQEFAAGASTVPVLNRPLAAAYVSVFEEMRATFGLQEGIPIALLAAQKDVISVKEGEMSEDVVRDCLHRALDLSLDAIEGMRRQEGEATQVDIEARLSAVEEMLSKVVERAPNVSTEWQAKLNERLARLGQDLSFDPQRVAQEIAIFADRCDISEEIVRFRSHLAQFRSLFDGAEPIGRQMDFLVQELNREVNTMGSKSNDAELTRLVVAMKAELEKVREQVQNIE